MATDRVTAMGVSQVWRGLFYSLNLFQFSQIADRKVGTKSVLLPPSHPAREIGTQVNVKQLTP